MIDMPDLTKIFNTGYTPPNPNGRLMEFQKSLADLQQQAQAQREGAIKLQQMGQEQQARNLLLSQIGQQPPAPLSDLTGSPAFQQYMVASNAGPSLVNTAMNQQATQGYHQALVENQKNKLDETSTYHQGLLAAKKNAQANGLHYHMAEIIGKNPHAYANASPELLAQGGFTPEMVQDAIDAYDTKTAGTNYQAASIRAAARGDTDAMNMWAEMDRRSKQASAQEAGKQRLNAIDEAARMKPTVQKIVDRKNGQEGYAVFNPITHEWTPTKIDRKAIEQGVKDGTVNLFPGTPQTDPNNLQPLGKPTAGDESASPTTPTLPMGAQQSLALDTAPVSSPAPEPAPSGQPLPQQSSSMNPMAVGAQWWGSGVPGATPAPGQNFNGAQASFGSGASQAPINPDWAGVPDKAGETPAEKEARMMRMADYNAALRDKAANKKVGEKEIENLANFTDKGEGKVYMDKLLNAESAAASLNDYEANPTDDNSLNIFNTKMKLIKEILPQAVRQYEMAALGKDTGVATNIENWFGGLTGKPLSPATVANYRTALKLAVPAAVDAINSALQQKLAASGITDPEQKRRLENVAALITQRIQAVANNATAAKPGSSSSPNSGSGSAKDEIDRIIEENAYKIRGGK